jgi:hypothetical protein
LLAGADEILWIENPTATPANVIHRHWIHVMDQKTEANFVAWYTEITPHVPEYDLVAYVLPLR